MNEDLKKCLEQDEQLLWSGAPEKFEVNDKTHQKGFLRRAVIAVVAGIVLSLVYLIAANKSVVKPGVFVVLWAICIYAIFSERISCKKISKLVYGLTDKRVVIYHDGSVTGFEYAGVTSYEFKKDDDGHNCLLVGKDAESLNMYKWRLLPIEPVNKNMDTGKVEKAGLYAIPDFSTFKKIYVSKAK